MNAIYDIREKKTVSAANQMQFNIEQPRKSGLKTTANFRGTQSKIECDLKYDMRPLDDLFRMCVQSSHAYMHINTRTRLLFSNLRSNMFRLRSHFPTCIRSLPLYLSACLSDSLRQCMSGLYSVATQCLFLVGCDFLFLYRV